MMKSTRLCALLTLAVLISASQATASTPGSRALSEIVVTKQESLLLSSIESSLLYSLDGRSMHTRTCLQTGGVGVPYRISAKSLNGADHGFRAGSQLVDDQITYDVSWFSEGAEHQLSDHLDVSEVIVVNSIGCGDNTLTITLHKDQFNAADSANYSDALSLFFIVE